jgi:hypothetical protein
VRRTGLWQPDFSWFFIFVIVLFFGLFQNPSQAQDLSGQAENAGKSVEKAIHDAAKKTGDYLKSDSFKQGVQRVVDGAGKAVQNAGKWIGDQMDSISKKGSQK